MRTSMKLVSSVLAVCMLASSSVLAGFAAKTDDAVGATVDRNVAAMEAIDAEYTYDGNDLGATYSPEQTVFKVWSPTATEVTLNRYATGSDSEEGHQNLGSVAMQPLMDGEKRTGVWTATVEGDLVNTFYTYTITSTHPYGGEVQTAETQDPYSIATGVNGKRSMIVDLKNTNPEGWESDTHVLLDKQSESTVWEVHVKDMSWDQASGVSDANRGKYLAFTETGTLNGEGEYPTMVDYLKDLGVTTVQINPFYDFGSVDEAGAADQFNWGYDPVNYNVPEGSYSSNPYDGNVRIKECKQMIQALHNAGISVVMDVVYNHTYSNHKDYSPFQGTVPDYYFRKYYDAAQNQDYFSNGSGCGNDVATERAMVHKYIVQSCMYWVNEYHVDGFRFDLMGLMDSAVMNDIRAQMDTVDPRLYIWGEGWDLSTRNANYDYTGARVYLATQKNASKVDSRVGFFNDAVRDGMKGSVFHADETGYISGNYSLDCIKAVKAAVYGNSYTSYKAGWTSRAPEQCVNYAACHDNNTLYDRLANSLTHVGIKSGDPLYAERNEEALRANRFAAGIIYTAQGIPFILAGEEFARTKYGNENSYNAPADLNKLDWSRVVEYSDLVSYYKGMMDIRRNFSPLTASTKDYQSKIKFNNTFSTQNTTITYCITNDQENEWNKMLVIHNGSARQQTVTLTSSFDTAITDSYEWVILAKGDQAGLKSLGTVTGRKFTVPTYSTLVVVDKAGYDAVGLTGDDTGVVEVKSVDMSGKAIAGVETIHVTVKIGTAYTAVENAAVSNAYILDHIDGNEKGTYSANTQTVKFVYRDAAKVTVKYQHENGTELAPSVTLYGIDGQSYSAPESTEIPEKYIFKEMSGEKDGTFSEAEEKTVTFIYKDAMEVVVKYQYTDGTELAPSVTLYGEPDEDYSAPESDKIPEIYMLKEIEGDKDGKFGTETKTVTFVYTNYVPESIRLYGDINNDGKINVDDVTALQRIFAEFEEVTPERMAQFDFNYDGKVNIADATMLQRYLAEMNLSQGTVTVNYYINDGAGTLIDSVTFKDRVGDDLVAPAVSVFDYVLDETKLPNIAGKKVSFGSATVVDYYYVEGQDANCTIHIKHSDPTQFWGPDNSDMKMWIWNSENYAGGSWPGVAGTYNPTTGWYDYSFEYNYAKEKTALFNYIVSNAGNPQTKDLNNIKNREIWVVVNDDIIENQTNFLTIYTANPDLISNPELYLCNYNG